MVAMIPVYLFLPWNKSFFGHFLARVLDFGMIDALISINSDGPLSKRRLMASMIRTFDRYGFGIFLQEHFCFLFLIL